MKFSRLAAAVFLSVLLLMGCSPTKEQSPQSSAAFTNANNSSAVAPISTPIAIAAVPQGASARCSDGSYSFSQHSRGTCSHHGGVSEWNPQNASAQPTSSPIVASVAAPLPPIASPTAIPASAIGVVNTAPRYDPRAEERKIEWRSISETDSMEFSYNTRKVTHSSDGALRVWTKGTPTDKKAYLASRDLAENSDYADYAYTLDLTEYRCSEREQRPLAFVEYDSAGHVIKSKSFVSRTWKVVIPDSIGEAILERACRYFN